MIYCIGKKHNSEKFRDYAPMFDAYSVVDFYLFIKRVQAISATANKRKKQLKNNRMDAALIVNQFPPYT